MACIMRYGSHNNRITWSKELDLRTRSFPGTPSLKKTRFTEFLIRENSLDERGFQEWVFCPGMLFNSLDKWWGDQGLRDRFPAIPLGRDREFNCKAFFK